MAVEHACRANETFVFVQFDCPLHSRSKAPGAGSAQASGWLTHQVPAGVGPDPAGGPAANMLRPAHPVQRHCRPSSGAWSKDACKMPTVPGARGVRACGHASYNVGAASRCVTQSPRWALLTVAVRPCCLLCADGCRYTKSRCTVRSGAHSRLCGLPLPPAVARVRSGRNAGASVGGENELSAGGARVNTATGPSRPLLSAPAPPAIPRCVPCS